MTGIPEGLAQVPALLPWVIGAIGGAMGGVVKDGMKSLAGKAGKAVVGGVAAATAFETAARAIWEAALALLRGAFGVVDTFSVFTVDLRSEPVSVLWPVMLWISGALAVALFCYQIIATSLRGGRGFLRLVTGPVQYGLALAVTVGMVAALLAAADGITSGILNYGLRTDNFRDALEHTGLGDAAGDGVTTVVLALVGVIGVLPVAFGYALEMIFREAGITVMVITLPITAAGLMAGTTKSWYWTTCRWILALIFMKPVLALALAIGVAMTGGSKGLSGLLVGVAVLLIAVFTPLALFKLLAFIDPHTPAGSALRDARASTGMTMAYNASGGPELTGAAAGGGGAAQERANYARFNSPAAPFGSDTDGFDDSAPDPDGSADAAGAEGGHAGGSAGTDDARPAGSGSDVSGSDPTTGSGVSAADAADLPGGMPAGRGGGGDAGPPASTVTPSNAAPESGGGASPPAPVSSGDAASGPPPASDPQLGTDHASAESREDERDDAGERDGQDDDPGPGAES